MNARTVESLMAMYCSVFFFQAEDGIRDSSVTGVQTCALPISSPPLPPRDVVPLERVEEVYRALVLGTRDYVLKNGFKHVVVGLSGGIDSSLVAALAVEALVKENVTGVTMPPPFTSAGPRRQRGPAGEHPRLAVPSNPSPH